MEVAVLTPLLQHVGNKRPLPGASRAAFVRPHRAVTFPGGFYVLGNGNSKYCTGRGLATETTDFSNSSAASPLRSELRGDAVETGEDGMGTV